MVKDDMDIKVLYMKFRKRNPKQQFVWIVYGLILIYQFFDLDRPHFFVFVMLSLSITFLLDRLLERESNDRNDEQKQT